MFAPTLDSYSQTIMAFDDFQASVVGPVLLCIEQGENMSDEEFRLFRKALGWRVLCTIIVSNQTDFNHVSNMMETIGCTKLYRIFKINEKFADKKYEFKSPPTPGSFMEILRNDVNIINPMVFNYLAEVCDNLDVENDNLGGS